MKIYTKGERVLRVETIAHNVKKLRCGYSLERFAEIVPHLQGMLERFMEVLSCMDQCFVGATLEELPVATQVGKTRVGGVDVNRPRMRWVVHAVLALASCSRGFTASQLAYQVRILSRDTESKYGSRHAAYDLKKLRGKQMVRRIEKTRRYEVLREGLRAMTALLVLRDKVLRPLLAAAQPLEPSGAAQNPTPIDHHYEVIRIGMQGVFHELGIAASTICCRCLRVTALHGLWRNQMEFSVGTIEEAHAEVKYGWAHAYSPEAMAQAVEALDEQPLGYRINIFLARLCFRGIYFPRMGRLAWLKVIAQNRQTIFKLAKEAVFGRRSQPRTPDRESPYGDAVTTEVTGEASA